MDGIKKALVRGDLAPGERVPSLRDLAVSARVNPNTVQHAYQELEREGVIFSRRGQGSFAAESPAKIAELRAQLAQQAVEGFIVEMRSLGIPVAEAAEMVRFANAGKER